MEARLLRMGCVFLVLFLFLTLGATPGAAQHMPLQPLITQPILESQLTTLKGNTHPLAQPQFDIGIASPNLPLQRMLLVLKRSPQQDFALRTLLDDQQDKVSPNYHKWLTPDQFGVQFGPSDQDVQLVTGWLQSHGFQVDRVAHGRSVIEFSGVESQVEGAFHTQIHAYMVNGQQHWANASDPQIPAALAPAVAGVWSLHNFQKGTNISVSKNPIPIPARGSLPLLTFQGRHALMPGDYSIIYNINPLYSSGITGQGATIAVVARSSINAGDVYSFRNLAGLPSPNLNVVNDGPDPGIFDPNEEFEADLDASWSGAIAPGAQINFVLSASTNTSDGVDLSELYIVDNNAGDVMTESFGSCEGFASQAESQGISSLAEQAAAEGITYMVSSGDSGAESCDRPTSSSANGDAPSVNVLASPPFTVAVGGTLFNEHGVNSTYWNTTNNPANLASAKSYIPEDVWNESCPSCGLWAGGGGSSVFFSKPNWQSGVQGIPSDGRRDLPDVSLTAAGHDPYLLCFEGSCQQGSLYGVSGTSASAPSFAGIMALVVQQYGRQGQANYVLYRLAGAETLAQCNGSSSTGLPASTCVFNDVTHGNNAVPGELGFGTPSAQYQAGTGYDLATGLGSVNAANLVNKWNTVTFSASSTILAPPSISASHGVPVMLSASVSPSSGTGTPTGDISLQTGTNPSNNPAFLTLSNGSVSAPVNNLPGGSYNLSAHYSGDAIFAPSDSNPVQVNITPENSVTTVSLFTAGPNGNPIPFTTGPYGGFVYPRADVSGRSGFGVPTSYVYFFDNGSPFAGPVYLNSQGNAALPNGYPWFNAGQHSLTATYNGDSSFNFGTSSPVSFNITQATTAMTVSASPSSVGQGSAVSLTANINSAAFAGQLSANFPSGTVTFFSGSTQLGSAQMSAGQLTQSGLTATAFLSISSLPTGQNSITAQYSGDTNYVASSAAAIAVNVNADFAFSASGPSITIPSPGGNGSLTMTITGQTGYNGTVTFTSASCSGLPYGAKCGFNPSAVTGSGNTVITVSTLAPTFAGLRNFGVTGLGLVFAGIFLLGTPLRRHRRAYLSVLVLSFVAAGIACGGGGGGGGGGNHSPGTSPGSYAITVTATSGTGSSAISHTTNFTLVVN